MNSKYTKTTPFSLRPGESCGVEKSKSDLSSRYKQLPRIYFPRIHRLVLVVVKRASPSPWIISVIYFYSLQQCCLPDRACPLIVITLSYARHTRLGLSDNRPCRIPLSLSLSQSGSLHLANGIRTNTCVD